MSEEHDRELHGERVELPGVGEEPRPVEGGHLLAEDALARGEEQHRAEQGERQAHAAEDQELPGRLQGGVPVLEGDQEHGGERRRLDRDPQDAEVVGHRDEEERRQVGGHEGEELRPLLRRHETRPLVAPQVPHAVQPRQQAHECRQDEHEGREAVDTQRPAERRGRLAGQEPPGRGESEDEGRREAADEHALLGPARAGEGAERGRGERNGERRVKEVHLIP